MNNILRSDFNEYIQNRNNAKLQFLQHEINQYYNLNKQLKDVLNLKKKSLELVNSKSIKLEKSNQMDIIALPSQYQHANKDEVLEQLFKENKQLLASFKIVNSERNNAQSKVLINQQVAEEMENFQQDILQEQEDSLLELRRIVQDKEYTVQEFEKQKSQVTNGGVIVKYRDIVTPTEQLSKLQNLNESYNQAVQVLKRQNEYLNELNKKYELENEFASFELIKLKNALQNPVNVHSLKYSARHPINRNSQYEDLVYNKFKTDIEVQQIEHDFRKKLFKLPKQNSLVSQNSINKKKIEEEWDRARKNFDREMINERILSDQITQLENYNQQLLLTNDSIMNSNQLHQSIIEKLQQNINFYKEYHKKVVKIQSKMKPNKMISQPQNNLIQSSNSISDISFSKLLKSGPQTSKSKGLITQKTNQSQQLIDSKRKADMYVNENSKIRTKTKLETVLNNSVDHVNIPTLNDEDDVEPEWNVRECKQFLKNLADEFYSSFQNSQNMILSRKVITKIQSNGGIGYQLQQKRFSRIRSISNILEYKRDKKNDDFYSNKKDLSQQLKRPQTHYINTENDEQLSDFKDVILEHIKSKNMIHNNKNNNNNINDNNTNSNNNSSTNNNTQQNQNGVKNLDQFGANSIQIQNSQFISNHNLPNIPIHQGEGKPEKHQPGDISTYLENAVDVSYELRNKQIAGGESNGTVFHNINGYPNGTTIQISQLNLQLLNTKQQGSSELKQSIISKKGTFISTHSPSYVPNGKKNTQILKQRQQFNNDEQQSFISNDDILNHQMLSSQNDIRVNIMTTQQEEKQ